jgi:UDP-GlcNAc:undecaprenyl-phosphate/decaprenyl-phosphate GlcNAc-1-phosphate transferase
MWLRASPLVVAFAISAIATLLTLRLARRHGWLVYPRADRWSRTPVAKFGGISVLLAFLLAVALFSVSGPLLRVVLLSTAMGVVGIVDDVFQLRPGWKFASQFMIAGIAISSGIVYGLFHSLPLNLLFTFLWILGVTNALNLSDNMDGLAAGISIIAAASLAVFAHSSGPMTTVLLAMVGSLLGFLLFNFQPAKIFMGDTGSLAIGFFLASCAVLEAGHVRTVFSVVFVPGLVFFLPIFDMLLVSVTRRLNGRAITAGAKDHVSHRLVMLGLSERGAVLTLYLLCALSGLVALLCRLVWSDVGPGILALFLLTAATFWFYLAKVQLPEEWQSRTNVFTFFVPEFLNSVGKRSAILSVDAGLIVLAEFLGYLLRFDGVPRQYLGSFLWTAVLLIVVKIPLFAIFSVYRRDWTIRALRDVYPIIKGSILGSMLAVTALTYITGFMDFSRAVIAIETILTICLMSFVRSATRFFDDVLPRRVNDPCLVVGGASVEFFYRYFEWQRSHKNIIAFVVPGNRGSAFLYGVPIVPPAQMPTFLSKVNAVYLLPDCSEQERLLVVQLFGARDIPVHALQLSKQTLKRDGIYLASAATV